MTDTIPVTLVTKNAANLEYMHNADYVRMVAALNKEFGKSYRWMEKESGCDVSFAQWAQIADGNRKLNPATRKGVRTMIAKVDELRDELPAIPDPVEVVTAEKIDPDAEMVLVGTLDPGERVRRVLMLAQSDVVLYVNGEVVAEPLRIADVTPVTPRAEATKRETVYRPVFSVAERDELEALGGIRAVLEAGKRALQEATNE